MIPPDYSKQLRRKLADGKTLDEALAELRAEGVSILLSIMAVEKVQRCGIADAKKTVHASPAWADMRARNEKFHEELEDALQKDDDDDERQRRMTILAWLFIVPTIVSFVGLGLAFVGLIARHSESSAHWGIWCSIIGWSLAIGGLFLRPLTRRLEKRWRD